MWYRQKVVWLAAFMTANLAGCASLNKEQCRSGDWYGIGLLDGTRGLPISRLADHQAACGEYGLPVDGHAYRQGRLDGLRKYCTAENGFLQGRSGKAYRAVCPEASEIRFRAAFTLGHSLWEASGAIARLQEERDSLEQIVLDETQSQDAKEDALKRLREVNGALNDAQKRLDRLRSVAIRSGYMTQHEP